MSDAGAAPVRLSRDQAHAAAQWLLNEYEPYPPPYIKTWGDAAEHRGHAQALGGQLAKAVRRKRQNGGLLVLQIRRDLAEWFAGSFSRREGHWFIGEREIHAQPRPEWMRPIAEAFLAAVNRRRGRPSPSLEALVEGKARLSCGRPDLRNLRRKQAEIAARKQERKWTRAALASLPDDADP